MLVMNIEIWPLGDKQIKREICKLRIWNDNSGDNETGNYGYRLNAGTETISGSITGHKRAAGALPLVANILKKLCK
jgi:hypothetical protein